MSVTAALLRARSAQFEICFAIIALLATACYMAGYVSNPWMPLNAADGIGWFASDQGKYRNAARALTELDFRSKANYYPPLFPWLGAPFVRWMPDHTYVVPSLLCLFLHIYGLARVGSRYFGRALTFAVIVFLLLAYPKLWLDQWIIPWTSSGVAALSSLMILLFDRGRTDRLTLIAFFLACGAIFATRPLDVLPFFPLAAALAWRALWPPTPRTIKTAAIITVSGLIFPAVYLIIAWLAYAPDGYLQAIRRVGFILGPSVIERAVSLWIDSFGIYQEYAQSIGEYFPAFIPALLLCFVSLFRAPMTIRFVALAVLISFTMYVPFSDLMPVNLLRYNVIHYFKWAMPWLILIAAGQFVALVRDRAWLPALSVTLMAALLMSLRIVTVPLPSRETKFVGDTASIIFEQETHVDLIDIVGGFVQFRPRDDIKVDGVPISGFSNVKILRFPWGTRAFFPQGAYGRSFTVMFPQPFTAKPDSAFQALTYRITSAYWAAQTPAK